MNAITQVAFVLILWLVMGIGFLSKATEIRRRKKAWGEALTSVEALLFYLSVLVPLAILVHRNIPL